MRDGSSTTEDTKSAGPSPLRLRVGVFLILLWIVPFWALAPLVADSLSGLLGFWVAGAAVKSIIKGSTMRHALGAIWSMLIHGDIRGQREVGNDPNEARPPREDA
jgi:cobalamin biosynthesis protein CobD/CbiB